MYHVLILIDGDISPSNEDCDSLQEYAHNCVSQSNSKNARDARYKFMHDIFLNAYPEISAILQDVMDFYGLETRDLVNKHNFTMINHEILNNAIGY